MRRIDDMLLYDSGAEAREGFRRGDFRVDEKVFILEPVGATGGRRHNEFWARASAKAQDGVDFYRVHFLSALWSPSNLVAEKTRQ